MTQFRKLTQNILCYYIAIFVCKIVTGQQIMKLSKWSLKHLCNCVSFAMLELVVNVNVNVDPQSLLILMKHATKTGDIRILNLLEKNKFDFNSFATKLCFKHHRNVFLALCARGHVQLLKYLVKICGIGALKILNKDVNGNNGLHLAILSRNPAMMNYLLSNIYFYSDNNASIYSDVLYEMNNKHETPILMV